MAFSTFLFKKYQPAILVLNGYKKRPVEQYSLDGEFIKRYESITEAKLDLRLKSNGAVSLACPGNIKTAGGYIWKYA